MSVVEALRQNDPARKCITFFLGRETSDAELAEALEQNPFVTDVTFDLDGEQGADWTSLLRVIATHANLETVNLQDAITAGERNAPAGLVRSILRAIQQNTSMGSVKLWWLRLPSNISPFLNNVSSIRSFKLFDCDMEPAEREQGARSLAAALQRNTSIESLELGRLDDIYAFPILESLRFNTSVKTFIFFPSSIPNVPDTTSHTLQRLLESTTSIRRFEFREASFSDERWFRPIAQGIINNESVCQLKFSWVRFQSRNSLAPLQSILQNKQNLTSLCLHECHFGGGQVHGDIISIVSRPDSLLRCFEFQSYNSLERGFPGIQFENLLQAIKTSKLERFQIGSIVTLQQLQTLTQSIPAMKLKELEVEFSLTMMKVRKKAGLAEKPSGRIYFTL